MRLRVESLVVLCSLVSGWPAGSVRADPDDIAARRARIEAETQRLEQAFAAEQAACAARFVVTDCSNEVRLRRRDMLGALRAQLLALDDAERRERAAARLAAIETKRQQQSSRPPEPAPPPAPAGRAAPEGPAPLIVLRRDEALARQQAASDAAARRAEASRRRQQQAEQAAERVRERLAEREREGKVAAPLPVPATVVR